VHFLHNWSWEPASVHAPVRLSDVLADTAFAAGDDVHLSAWDVRVLSEE
jgi:beta-galactosidase